MAEYNPSKIIKDGNTYNFRDDTKIPLAGSNAISGSLIPATTNAYDLGGASYQWNNAYIKSLTINGVACGDILTHNVSEFVPRSGGAVITGSNISRIDNTDVLAIRGGSGYDQGAQLTLYGKDATDGNGYARLYASDGTNKSELVLRPNSYTTILCTGFLPQRNLALYPTLGNADYKWGQIYSTNSTISTSDSRLKNSIKDIDDSLLDAWETIQPKQYKFNDASEKKGDLARFHTGYLAQDIEKACTDNNLDISKYGLFCYDSWEEQEEKKDENGQVVEPYKPKGDLYSLRYEEALVVECMYLRRCIARLTARIEELEKGNNTK